MDCSSSGSLADIKQKFFEAFSENFQHDAADIAKFTLFNFQRKCVPLEDEHIPFVKALNKVGENNIYKSG